MSKKMTYQEKIVEYVLKHHKDIVECQGDFTETNDIQEVAKKFVGHGCYIFVGLGFTMLVFDEEGDYVGEMLTDDFGDIVFKKVYTNEERDYQRSEITPYHKNIPISK